MKNIQDLRDKAVLLGWIAGLLLLISLIWIFSQPLQAHYLLRSINYVFINNNDDRRVISYIKKKPGKTDLMGYWYSMYNTKDNMFVFMVFKDGILIPLGAIVSDNGDVRELIPLSAHAVQIFDNMPQSILQMYVRQIEKTAL
ncbi:MAG: hypothetical protein FWF68_01330 [Spirochaetes bacterium]|nr:hypothetical protein [Brevinematales bacterium]MCL1958221.1 hypothetical protein [Spirochaetota bacterium]